MQSGAAAKRNPEVATNDFVLGDNAFMSSQALLCDGSGVNAVFQIEDRSNGAHDAGMPVESEALPQAIHALDAGAMCAQDLCGLKFLELARRPVELLVRRVEEMESPNRRIHGHWPNHFPRILERVDDP